MPRDIKEDFRSKVEVRPVVGSIQGKQLRFLAHVEVCNKETCPVGKSCSFNPNGRCTVMYNFLRSLYFDWVDPKKGVGDVLTQIQLDRIGTHLMPLYHQLARFTLEASVLPQTTYTGKQGNVCAYPQFKEIREVLREIRAELKELNLEAVWARKFPDKPLPYREDVDEVMMQGRENSYDEMVKRAQMMDRLARK